MSNDYHERLPRESKVTNGIGIGGSPRSIFNEEDSFSPDPFEQYRKSIESGPPIVLKEQGENPKKQFGDLKAPIGNTPPAAIIEMERVMAMGGVKYGPFNYREARINAMTYIGANGRHWALWQDGEDVDPETGCLHLAAIMANCALMIDCIKTGQFVDDRSKTGTVRKTLDEIAIGHNKWETEYKAKTESSD